MSAKEDDIIDVYAGNAKGLAAAFVFLSFLTGTVGWINDWSERTVEDIDPKVTIADDTTYLSGWPFVPQLKTVTQSFNEETGTLCRKEATYTAPLFIPADIETSKTCKTLTLQL